MEILKSEQYISEKLGIQPVTKDRLGNAIRPNMYKTPSDMRGNFKTGDICLLYSSTAKELCVFLSYEDFASDKYPFIAKELCNSETATAADILKIAYK